MAARAVARANIDWSTIATRVTKGEVSKLNRLKAQIDATATQASGLPDSLPKIDWSHYKQHASDPKLVEELEKKYSAIKVEAPKAPSSRLADLKVAQEQDEQRFKQFEVIAKSYIESIDVVKKKFENMIPVKDMTLEDWCLTFPQWSFSIEHPSIAPHYGRAPGLTREEAASFDQPDPEPYANKKAWKDWEEKYKKHYV